MRHGTLLWTIYIPLVAILVLGLALAGGISAAMYRSHAFEHSRRDLMSLARVAAPRFAPAVAAGDEATVQRLCRELGDLTDVRLTVILSDGRVIGDSAEDPAVMGDHGDRPEVRAALAEGTGASHRYSRTTDTRRVYTAVVATTSAGGDFVVRASHDERDLDRVLRSLAGRVVLVGVLVAFVGGLASFLITRGLRRTLIDMRRQAEAVSAGDFGQHLQCSGPGELVDLAQAMNSMSDLLERQIEDIEGQRQELEAVMDSMIEGVIALDSEETVIRMNRTAYELLGAPEERSLGRSIQEVARHPGITELAQMALAGDEVAERDLRVGPRSETCLQVTATELARRDGTHIGVLLVLNDVTQLRRLENMRRDFVANVSHELKTPITSIKGFVETLLEAPPRDKANLDRFLDIIRRQADRLDAIISDLLALSRLEQESRDRGVEMHGLSLRPVLERVVRELATREPEGAARIVLSCGDDVRARLNAQLLEQAVGNLIDNALKYSGNDSPVVLSCRGTEDAVEVSVADQGPGIPAEHLPRIFERFYRVDKARSRRMGGTGLGLAIVKHIAQAHRGSVAVDSEIGGGSTFTIRLPREVPA